MAIKNAEPVISIVLDEKGQQHKTRQFLFEEIEKELNIPVVSFFTSFSAPVGNRR